MRVHDLTPWQHSHHYLDDRDVRRQRRTEWVVGLTLVTMVLELIFGFLTGSMALLADGWHMGSHVAALGIAVFAYRYARRQSGNARFTFGTGKVGALGGYTSAVFLALVAVLMAWESIQRLREPVPVAYDEALLVAVLGLVVNLLSAWLLRDDHEHHHDHDHDHGEHQDHNLQGAFMHVLADLVTSVLAVIALLAGRHLGWSMLDPVMGLVGAAVILYWARGLLRASGRTLLDAEDHSELQKLVEEAIESRPDHRVVDLHIWRLGPSSRGCIVSILSHAPEATETYKAQLLALPGIDHVTVEINRCDCPLPLQ